MRIVINHLTRMRGGYICVAGLDTETTEHVRPVLQQGALPFDLLARYGGPFDMAWTIDLGTTRHAPDRPHIEDHAIVPSRLKRRDLMPAEDFWALLVRSSKSRLRDLFGSDLRRVGRSSCGTDVGTGDASLACFCPKSVPRLFYLDQGPGGRSRIRMRIHDDDFDAVLGVTDLRLYGSDHMTPDRQIVESVAARLQSGERAILGVGLTRPYASPNQDAEPVHWLQVTNVHLESDPTWQLK